MEQVGGGVVGLDRAAAFLVDTQRHLFADVRSEHAKAIIAKLNRSRIKGHKVKAKLAQSGSDPNETRP